MELLHSKIIGEGQPLIILHGFLGMSDNWKTLGNEYAKNGFQVHLIDQRNHGRSFHSDDFDYQHMVSDLLHYLDYYQLDNIYLLGHSMGGKTAMLFATKHPDRVSKLIVADIGPKYYAPHHQDILEGLNALDFTQIKSRTDADKELSQYLRSKSIRQFLLKNLYWVEKEELGFRFNLKILTEKVENIGISLPDNAIFDKSSLFLRGDKSDYITKSDESSIKQLFPLATITTITNAGHWLHAENPKMFFERTMDFLQH